MKEFPSASLAEAGVFAIRQTLRRILREMEEDTAPRQRIDAETGKRAIDVDVMADREFTTQLHHYDDQRYASVIVTGEERPEVRDIVGTIGTFALVDAIDGSDLAERGLSNWCSSAVFFNLGDSTAQIQAVVVGMPPDNVYFATNDDPRVRVYRDLPDLERCILAKSNIEPVEVEGLPPSRTLYEASLYFYGQKANRLRLLARSSLLAEVDKDEYEDLRIFNLGGIPMLVRMCDHQVKGARGVDAVFELAGQRPYDAVPGLFFALRLGAKVLSLAPDDYGSPMNFESLEQSLLKHDCRLRYLVTANSQLADDLLRMLQIAANE